MTLGRRIEARRSEIGISQAELARRVGIRQSTMHSLIKGDSRSSRSIVALARELSTTPAYLTGETDDPAADAPPPAPAPRIQHVLMPVAVPSQPALERMFVGLLKAMPADVPQAEQARLLAKWLPTGLMQLRDLVPHDPTPSAPFHPPASEIPADEALAIPDREPQ